MKFTLEQAVEVLSRTPGVLRSMLGTLSDPWIYNTYGVDTFCPFDVVGHLILGEKTDWIVRTRIILACGEAEPFEPFDRYAMYAESQGRSLTELLNTFDTLRGRNLEELSTMRLTPEQLSMRGTHPDFGSVTLESLLATWVTHDLNHIHQIAKCMAYQYRDAVGPWRPYQGIFRD